MRPDADRAAGNTQRTYVGPALVGALVAAPRPDLHAAETPAAAFDLPPPLFSAFLSPLRL
jgi:hypothetical protein